MGFLRAFDPRRALLAVATLLVAFFCGHLMQAGIFSDTAIRDDGLEAAPVLQDSAKTPALPVPPAATLSPLDLPEPPAPRIETNDALIDSNFPTDGAYSPYGLSCDVTMALQSAPDAMLRLNLSAPCRPEETLEIQHEHLVFSATTDPLGQVQVTLPAMQYRAKITARFADGAKTSGVHLVPDVDSVRRVALVWSGPQTLRIRAEGPDGAVGQMHQLGDLPGAEVYTLPVGSGSGSVVVRLTLEAEVTADNCGRFVQARTVQAGAIGGAMVRDVSFEMLSCNAIGETARFEGAFRDLRIAAR